MGKTIVVPSVPIGPPNSYSNSSLFSSCRCLRFLALLPLLVFFLALVAEAVATGEDQSFRSTFPSSFEGSSFFFAGVSLDLSLVFSPVFVADAFLPRLLRVVGGSSSVGGRAAFLADRVDTIVGRVWCGG